MAQAEITTDEEERRDSAFESLIGYNLKRAYVIVEADFKRSMKQFDLSPRVFAALSFVVTSPGLTQSDLARRLGIERSGLVAIIDELEAREFMKREPVPGDRRVQALRPLPAGLEIYNAAMVRAQSHEDILLGGLDAAEKQTLLTLLGKIRASGETT